MPLQEEKLLFEDVSLPWKNTLSVCNGEIWRSMLVSPAPILDYNPNKASFFDSPHVLSSWNLKILSSKHLWSPRQDPVRHRKKEKLHFLEVLILFLDLFWLLLVVVVVVVAAKMVLIRLHVNACLSALVFSCNSRLGIVVISFCSFLLRSSKLW